MLEPTPHRRLPRATLLPRRRPYGRGGGGGGGGRNQLFVMRLDGGEAKRVTEARDGVSTFSFSKDGKSVVYASGRTDGEQLYTIPIAELWQGDFPKPTQLTRHVTG